MGDVNRAEKHSATISFTLDSVIVPTLTAISAAVRPCSYTGLGTAVQTLQSCQLDAHLSRKSVRIGNHTFGPASAAGNSRKGPRQGAHIALNGFLRS
jgi:hypothetical protein